MKHHITFIKRIFSLCSAAFILGALPLTASSTEPKSDNLLSALQLPPDPKILESFETVYESTRAIQTEADSGANAAVVRKLQVKHVGENRLLARIEFDQKPQTEGRKFLLYLDTDNNSETGRTGTPPAQGIDLMVILSGIDENIMLYNPALSPETTKSRAVFVDKVLYITVETPLPKGDGPIPLRGWILSQRVEPVQSDSSQSSSNFTLPRHTLPVPPLTQEKSATQL